MMMRYETPDNVEELLDKVVVAARKTRFYPSVIPGDISIVSVSDLALIPVTPLAEYRRQPLSDVLAEPDDVQWIAGALGGQNPDTVAIAEGPEEAAIRFDIFMDALKDCLPDAIKCRCAIVSSAERRYFAAETATILIHSGIPANVFLDDDRARIYEFLDITRPEILVILVDEVDEAALPENTKLCVTFRRSQRLRQFPQLDMYLVDGLGFLGQSTDCQSYRLNNDEFLFQISNNGKMVVTALRNRVRPVIRLELQDRAKSLTDNTIELVELSAKP